MLSILPSTETDLAMKIHAFMLPDPIDTRTYILFLSDLPSALVIFGHFLKNLFSLVFQGDAFSYFLLLPEKFLVGISLAVRP